MLAAFLSASAINKILAIVALILAFPPVFTRKGHTEGLLFSLSLVLFYLFRGLISLGDGITVSRHSAIRPSQIFAFAELPAICSTVYFGLKLLPEWLAGPYEWLLLASSPVFILLEGISSMVIILECGERLSDALVEASSLIKSIVAIVCFGTFGISLYAIVDIYMSGLLSIFSASFVASACTVLLGLTGLTIFIEHGTITDAAMLSLYVTYNVWCMTRSWKDQFLSAVRIESVFDYFSNPLRFLTSSYVSPSTTPILTTITSLTSMFSVEIVVHLMIQMCVFVLAVKLIGRAIRRNTEMENNEGPESDEKHEPEPENFWLAYQDWIFNVIWPSFGKLVLILVYTYAWILHTRPEFAGSQFSWYNPTTWRYINVAMVLVLYLKHLLTPPDEPVLFKLD